MKRFIVAAIVLVAAGGLGSWWLIARDSGDDVAAFFTLSTPTACETGGLTVDVSNAHFAAFTTGRVPAQASDKFFVAEAAVRNDGASSVNVAEENFYLTERAGTRRPPAALEPGTRPLSAALDPGATLSATHEEWLVP